VITALRHADVAVSDAERQGWGIQAQFTDPDGNGFVLLQQGEASALG
jgi:predicted enzyme related to lactoylglutathione lyase